MWDRTEIVKKLTEDVPAPLSFNDWSSEQLISNFFDCVLE
jgi:hypothetical protein